MESIDKLVRPTIKNLRPYSSARDEFSSAGGSMTFLDANENPFENGVNRYPDPHQRKLKKVLAGLWKVSEEQLLLGNGSDEVLDLLLRVFCEPYKDAIISLPPTYGMYKVLAGINAIKNIEIPLNKHFQPDVPAILKQAGPETKMLFLCSPNNPTGNTLSRDLVTELIEGFPGLVVIDEAYVDFSEEESYAELLQAHPNLVVTRTLSKAYGMAGIRLGICLASPQVISYLKLIKPPYNVNELTQQFAINRLADTTAIEEEIDMLKAERERLRSLLAGIPFVRYIFPSQANFILLRVDDASLRYKQLIDAGIVVRNRSSQHGCEQTLRITIGTRTENDHILETLNKLSQTPSQ